jgi:poly(A) polymerase
VRRLAPLVASVSPERVRDELGKILRHGRGEGLRLLRRSNLLAVVLPEVVPTIGTPQTPLHHPEGDVFAHTALVLDRLDLDAIPAEDAEALLWGALLHDVGKPSTKTVDPDGRIRFNGHDATGAAMTEDLLRRLRLPNRRVATAAELVDRHMVFPNLPKMRQNRLRQFLGAEHFRLHLALHRADCGASHGDLSLAAFCEERLAAFRSEPVLPPPVLSGHDLLERGYVPGPRLGRILAWVRERQLDGEIADREDAVRRVLSEFAPDASGPPAG